MGQTERTHSVSDAQVQPYTNNRCGESRVKTAIIKMIDALMLQYPIGPDGDCCSRNGREKKEFVREELV